jgi:3-phenylpropionate/cinnamic acid dioxygenase small subunit
MYEDLFLLKVRVERLAGARTFSQKPRSRAMHVLQAPQIDEMDAAANVYRTWTPFLYVETRGDERDYQSGWAKHELTEVDGELRMRLKRVELLNFDAPLGSIQLFV